jgi:hypothetical protein
MQRAFACGGVAMPLITFDDVTFHCPGSTRCSAAHTLVIVASRATAAIANLAIADPLFATTSHARERLRFFVAALSPSRDFSWGKSLPHIKKFRRRTTKCPTIIID